MKRILTTLLITSAVITWSEAQTQRRVLVEEFTQASCPPCATYNPAFNAMLTANETKLTQIKYQTDWPGFDPMNLHNPAQVQTRVTYYSITGVPTGVVDGNYKKASPANITAADINNRWNVTSPMEVEISHTIVGNQLTAHAVFRATGAVSGNLRGHVVVIEREVLFQTPPGTNGEKEFYGVMKRMLPSDQGTTLPTAMAAGDSVVVDVNWTMANVYNVAEIAVVAFVQNNTTKEVINSEMSDPLPLALDAKLSTLTGTGFTCANAVTPDVTIENTGLTPLTSCDLTYSINGGAAVPLTWTGSLATGASAVYTLPNIGVTSGKNTLQVNIVNINGTPDLNPKGNVAKGNVYAYMNAGMTTPVTQNFSALIFPPTDWILDNPGDDIYKWIRGTQSSGGGTGSAKIPFFDIPKGSGVDNLASPKLDLSSLSAPISMTFDLAHKRKGAAFYDKLTVFASDDCGATWTQVWQKLGAGLATTTGFTTVAYTPVAADWKTQSINLDSYAGQPDLILMFEGTSDNGNQCYVDNFNLFNGTASINENIFAGNISISPNPSSNGIFQINFGNVSSGDVSLKITNAIGQEITNYDLTRKADGTFEINMQNKAIGTYMVTVTTSNATVTKQISIIE